MNKVVCLTSSRLQRRSEQRQSPSSHHPLSKTWAPSSKVDTHMPEGKHRQHYHYFTLQNNRVLCFTTVFVFLELLITMLRRREWQHIISRVPTRTLCVQWFLEKRNCFQNLFMEWQPQVETWKQLISHITARANVDTDFFNLLLYYVLSVWQMLTFAILPISYMSAFSSSNSVKAVSMAAMAASWLATGPMAGSPRG